MDSLISPEYRAFYSLAAQGLYVQENMRKLISYYVEKSLDAKEPKKEELDFIWSAYLLDQTLENNMEYIEKLRNELVEKISSLTKLSKNDISTILDYVSNLTGKDKITPLFSLPTFMEEGIVKVGEISISNPQNVTSLPEIMQLLRYHYIQGYISNRLPDIEIQGFTKVCVNTLYTPGCGMFSDDVNSLGMPLDFIQSLDKQSNLIIYLPSSMRCSVLLLTQIDEHLMKFPDTRVIAIGKHDNLKSNKLKKEKFAGFYVYLSHKDLIDVLKKNSDTNVPSFPYSNAFMPTFDEMFQRLSMDITHNMKWSVSRMGCKLGVVNRSFPGDYYDVDSIADIHAEEARIHCNEENKLSPYNAWIELVNNDPLIINLSVREQRELVYNKTRGCNVFNATLAAYGIQRFLGQGCSVLDPTSGWGERAIATFAAGGVKYRGWDTNPDLHPIYAKQKTSMEDILEKPIDCEIKYGPFEDDSELFDTIYSSAFDGCYTSPPFLFLENYTGDETSTSRYDTVKKWIDGFFLPMLKSCYKGIRAGGYLMAYLPSGPKDYKKGMDISSFYTLSQMYPYAAELMETLGASYEGVLGYYTEIEGITPKIRETFIWRKPYFIQKVLPTKVVSIEKKTEKKAKKVVEKKKGKVWKVVDEAKIHSDSSLVVGTFTRGIEYFSRFQDSNIIVISKFPQYDTEVICYACSQYKIKCTVIIDQKLNYKFNAFGATIQYVANVNSIRTPENSIVLSDGCAIPGLIDMVAEKVKQEIPEIPSAIWCFNSPGIVALLSKLYPDAILYVVYSGEKPKYVNEKIEYVKSTDLVRAPARTLPSFPALSLFDAKTWKPYSDRKTQSDWLWINK